MTVEKTHAGMQFVLPGAERLSESEIAKRRAQELLKPSAVQLPCDIGLFSDDAEQVDLLDLIWTPED